MKWLFIHQNFPGQYLHVVRRLAEAGEEIVGIGQKISIQIEGVHWIGYVPPQSASAAHEYVREIDITVQNGLSVARECERLKDAGFVPDIIIGHNGWGETLYVKDVWPAVPLLAYFEFFYRPSGSDIGFDPEFPADANIAKRLRTRNAVNLLGLDAADWGQTPTRWQRSQYPKRFWGRISIIHEGVDTDHVRPDATAQLWLKGGLSLGRNDEVITYSSRNLEPYRGIHTFLRALPKVLRSRPNAHAVIVGGDDVSYGTRPSGVANWRQHILNELGDLPEWKRVHFVGRIGFLQYLSVLQVSTVHVYLTYPFVLSWSLLEALSAGCLVIGSRTPPVQEVIVDGRNGYLTDFFDVDGLADRIVEMLQSVDQQSDLRAAARATVIANYDLRRVCLPAYFSLLQQLTGRELPPTGVKPSTG